MSSQTMPRLLFVMMGNAERSEILRSKYDVLIEALKKKYPLVEVYDASLKGIARYLVALLAVHPNKWTWQQRYYMSTIAFRLRSRELSADIRTMSTKVDVILQDGLLYDAQWLPHKTPSVVYEDYTARLSQQNPLGGRFPYSDRNQEMWIELEQQAMQRASHLCVRSQIVFNSMVNDYGIPKERVSVVGAGVNLKSLPAVNKKPNNEMPTFLFIGSDFYRKGGDLALHAFARLKERTSGATMLVLTNDSIPSDVPLAGVELIPPQGGRELVESLYKRADVFVLPSRLETWGDVLLEAMAYHLPCVGVLGQPMEEIIQNGKTGFLVKPENIDELFDAMMRLANDTELRQRMGRSARQSVEERYNWEHIVEKIDLAIMSTFQINEV